MPVLPALVAASSPSARLTPSKSVSALGRPRNSPASDSKPPARPKHPEHLDNVPTWDAYNQQLSMDHVKLRMSKSLARVASRVSLQTGPGLPLGRAALPFQRPSVAEAERKRAQQLSASSSAPATTPSATAADSPLQGSSPLRNSSASLLLSPLRTTKPRRRGPQPLSEKAEERYETISRVTARLQDEELVEQELATKLQRLKRGQSADGRAHVAQNSENRLETIRQWKVQLGITNKRADTLKSKADDMHDASTRLRSEINALRAEFLANRRRVASMSARIAQLDSDVPRTIDSTSQDLHDCEKLYARMQTLQLEHRANCSSQERSIEETREEAKSSIRLLRHLREGRTADGEVARRKEYLASKQMREEKRAIESKLGYSKWLSAWWAGQFEELCKTTQFHIDLDAEGDDAARMLTERMLTVIEQNDSLIDFLQTQANEITETTRDLRELSEQRHKLEEEALHDASDERLVTEIMAETEERNETAEAFLLDVATPALSLVGELRNFFDRLSTEDSGRYGSLRATLARLIKGYESVEALSGTSRKLALLDACIENMLEGVSDLHHTTRQLVEAKDAADESRKSAQEKDLEVKFKLALEAQPPKSVLHSWCRSAQPYDVTAGFKRLVQEKSSLYAEARNASGRKYESGKELISLWKKAQHATVFVNSVSKAAKARTSNTIIEVAPPQLANRASAGVVALEPRIASRRRSTSL